MKWRDSDDDTIIADEGDDLSYDGNQFSLKKESDSSELRPNLFKKNLIPLIAIVAGVFFVIGLIVIFFSGPSEKNAISQSRLLESKIAGIQDRMNKLEFSIKENAEGIKKGENLIQVKMKRLDRLETSISQKMNDLAKQLESLKRTPVAVQPPKTPPPKAAAVSKGKQATGYHIVSAGENLYRISLRYNIKLNELLQLNNLAADAVIQPGQRLLVSPAGR